MLLGKELALCGSGGHVLPKYFELVKANELNPSKTVDGIDDTRRPPACLLRIVPYCCTDAEHLKIFIVGHLSIHPLNPQSCEKSKRDRRRSPKRKHQTLSVVVSSIEH